MNRIQHRSLHRNRVRLLAAIVMMIIGSALAATAETQRVLLVAVDGRGEVERNLSGASIDVFANGRRIESFTLERRLSSPDSPTRRVNFLIFDTLSTTHRWLSQAKAIAEQLLSASAGGEFLLLSLEPGSGLQYLLGPTADRAALLRALRRKIVARQPGKALENYPHRFNQNDGLLVSDPRTAKTQTGELRTERDEVSAPNTRQDEQKKGDLFLDSLSTLNAALSGFSDSVKSVYLFSEGIATRATYQDLSRTDYNARLEVQTVDNRFLNSLAALAGIFKTSGALVFIVNSAGAQVTQTEADSGESQLRMLAEKSGGRYLEGEPEAIAAQLTASEKSFYEVVFPPDGLGSGPVEIEIRSREPGVTLYYGRRVFAGRGLEQLNAGEKMKLALDAAGNGYASRIALRLHPAGPVARSEDRDKIVFRLDLSADFRNSPLEVFRVWLGKGSRPPLVEMERLDPAGKDLSITVPKKKGYRIRVVIVEPRSAAAVVIP
jgi:hypothetical protein